MMKIECIKCNMLQENCYIASDETKECVVIDCGAFYEEDHKTVCEYIDNNGLKPVHLLCTHGHLDHNMGNNTMLERYGLKPEVHRSDEKMMHNYKNQAIAYFQMEFPYDLPMAETILEDGDTITFGNTTLRVLHTPGHSRGSVCFYSEADHVLFSGDTLFSGTIGRTDLDCGSMMQIIQSLRVLAQLPDETRVLPGHGHPTTIGYELAHNPYMDR